MWPRESVEEELGKQEHCPESSSVWCLCCVSLCVVLNTSVPQDLLRKTGFTE